MISSFLFILIIESVFCGIVKRDVCGSASKLSIEEHEESVKTHNNLRSIEGASDELEMTFSQELADRSQEWADKCVWDHGLTKSCNGDSIGQNMYLSGGGSQYPELNMTLVVTDWYNEKVDYNYAAIECKENKMCGHYTQVVWSKTNKVGCGYSKCDELLVGTSKWTNAIIVVCDYSPAGNFQNTKIYEQGTPCSKCAQQVEQGYMCRKNLCSPCLPKDNPECVCEKKTTCLNDGVWDDGICSCSCKPGFYGKSCENSCVCADLYVDVCPTWTGFCADAAYETFMKQTCPKTCGKCDLPDVCVNAK